MYLGVPNLTTCPEGMEDDLVLSRRRASLQLWATCSVENLNLSHDDSVVQTRTRGRSKLRKNKCLSWLGRVNTDISVVLWRCNFILCRVYCLEQIFINILNLRKLNCVPVFFVVVVLVNKNCSGYFFFLLKEIYFSIVLNFNIEMCVWEVIIRVSQGLSFIRPSR